MVTAVDQTMPSSNLVGGLSGPSVHERAIEIAHSGDITSARTFLAQDPEARMVLEDELLRAGQLGMLHELSMPTPGGRQFHENEITLIQQGAQRFADRLSIQTGQHFSAAQAERILAQTAYARINPGAPEPEQPQFEHAALEFLAANNPHTLLAADPAVPGAQQSFYFSSSPAQRTDSRIYASTLESHAAFYKGNGLLRDPGGAAQRAEAFEQRMGSAQAWTVAAPGIATSLVLAPVAPTLVANARYFVLTHPASVMEGTDLVGGFIAGDALAGTNGLLVAGARLGPAAAGAIASRTEGNFLQRAGRALSELFNTPARESAQRIQQSLAKAVEAGKSQLEIEKSAGNLTKQLSNAQGRIGEATVSAFLKDQGYEVLGHVVNSRNNGLDLVARAKDGRLIAIEVKGTTTGTRVAPSAAEKFPEDFLNNVVDSATKGTGLYGKVTQDSKTALEALQKAKENGTPIDYRYAVVYLDKEFGVQGLVMDRWVHPPVP